MGVGPWLGVPRATLGAEGGGGQRGQQIMLRVRPRSTWRRTTRCVSYAWLIMRASLRGWTPLPQTEIPWNETMYHDVRHGRFHGARARAGARRRVSGPGP